MPQHARAKSIVTPQATHQRATTHNKNRMTEQHGALTLVKTDHLYTNAPLTLFAANNVADVDLNLSDNKAIKASEIARKNANFRSTGWCAKYVRQALNIAGIPIRKVPRAKDYGPELKKNGFKPVNVSHSQAKAGDVVIF